ncbi:MAG: YiiX/YebB-like N1pC/P60 family cysteine hydrolase [Flavisolibacter sp.]
MFRSIALLFTILFTQCSFAQEWKKFHFRQGDFLFQDYNCGELCDAIEAVTPGIQGKHFSHMGLITIKGDSTFVIEAIGADVHLTPLSKFLNRQLDKKGDPKIVVGRLKKNYQYLNRKAIAFALQQMGKPYDEAFIYNNGKYYCSELIYDAYKQANNNRPFFTLFPMTFKDPKTGSFFPAWEKYYKNLHRKIPQNQPGCNPGSIANSNKIQIIHSFY